MQQRCGTLTGRRSACHIAKSLLSIFMNIIAWGSQVTAHQYKIRFRHHGVSALSLFCSLQKYVSQYLCQKGHLVIQILLDLVQKSKSFTLLYFRPFNYTDKEELTLANCWSKSRTNCQSHIFGNPQFDNISRLCDVVVTQSPTTQSPRFKSSLMQVGQSPRCELVQPQLVIHITHPLARFTYPLQLVYYYNALAKNSLG